MAATAYVSATAMLPNTMVLAYSEPPHMAPPSSSRKPFDMRTQLRI